MCKYHSESYNIMTQGKLSKEEATHVLEAVNDMFEAIPKSRRLEYLGHLNDIALFLEAAKRELPEEDKNP
jgi:hypothetical protein